MVTKQVRHVENFADLPSLNRHNNRIKSKKSTSYNCIAYAAGVTNANWWPSYHPDAYWPPNAPVDPTIEAFIKAFELLGYTVSASGGAYVKGVEKVALYSKDGSMSGHPTHAARQIGDNKWKSKLGHCYDIEHTEDAVSSGIYGRIAVFLERPKPRR